MRRVGTRVNEQQHAGGLLRRVRAGEVRCEEFLYELKAGPAGGRLRRPSSAGSLHLHEVACVGAGAERQQEFEVSRPATIGEAAAVFHALITAHDLRVEELTARSAWQVFGDYGRVTFETPDLPDADGLLYQYGMHRLRRWSLFELDLVRQFEVVDAGGDHDHYVQMHCTLRYAPTPELAALGADHCWWFPDQGALAAWLHSVATRPEWAVLDAQEPKQVAVYQEDV
jgi:hypothetical protein